MAPAQVADKAWEIVREEAVIEENSEHDRGHSYLESVDEEDEGVVLPTDAVVGTSFDEKSDKLHGYQGDVVDIHPDEHFSDGGDEQGLL